METDIQISKHYTKGQLLKYALPAIFMMFVVSAYEIIDGFFISNFLSSTAFAAVNLIFPVLLILASFGMMIGSGSSAIIANKMGQGNPKVANRYFSMFVYFTIVVGIILSVLGIFFIKPVCVLLGAEGELLEIASYYGLVSLISMPAYILQMAFSVYFNTAGKPHMGLVTSIACAVSITVLDLILVVFAGLGLNGILIATITTEYIGAIIPIVYFANKKTKSLLHFVGLRDAFKNQNPSNLWLIFKSMVNGSSEAVQEIASSLVVLLCIFQLNRFIGEPGIVAYGIIEYAWMVFNAFYLGYSIAVAPLMSYQQGAKDSAEMQSLFKNSLTIIIIASVVAFALSEIFAPVITSIFIGYDQSLVDIAVYAFRIYSVSFLFAGIAIYGSSLFTSLGNGVISALIAFLRTLVFETTALLIIPEIMGADGIWCAISFAEIMAAIMTLIFIFAKGKKYKYLKSRK